MSGLPIIHSVSPNGFAYDGAESVILGDNRTKGNLTRSLPRPVFLELYK